MKKNMIRLIAFATTVCMLFAGLPTFVINAAYNVMDTPGVYRNNFDTDGNLSQITEDFNIYYDSYEHWDNTMVDVTDAPQKYLTVANNCLERVCAEDEVPDDKASEANRPFWGMAYYTYKKQTFTNFELTVDARFSWAGTSYNAITVGTMGEGLKSNNGFTLGFWNDSQTNLYVYLGNAADVDENFDDWYIHPCAGRGLYTHESENYNYQIKLTVKDGCATVTIGSQTVLTNIYVGQVDGYISLVHGLSSRGTGNDAPSYYDNLSITSFDNSRTENNGEYSNNFENTTAADIYNDFSFYYDTSSSTENSLDDISDNPSKYVIFANNRLERVRANDELGYWDDGNRPYWCMAYYTYKNRTFKNFHLKVDAYMPNYGNAYNAITVGDMGAGLKSNNGFTVGFRWESDAKTEVYIGGVDDVRQNFDGPYIHECSGKGVFEHESNNYNFNIDLYVKDSTATLKINGTTVLENISVRRTDGYISLVNGLASGAYYDNLSIVSLGDEQMNYLGTDQSVVSVALDDITDISYIGVKLIYTSEDALTESKTTCYQIGTNVTSADYRGMKPYYASRGKVYYCDVNGNGSTGSDDLMSLKKHLLGAETAVNENAADVNTDRAIDIRDLVRLKKVFSSEQLDTKISKDLFNYAFYIPDTVWNAQTIEIQPYYISNGDEHTFDKYQIVAPSTQWRNPSTVTKVNKKSKITEIVTEANGKSETVYISFPTEGGVRVCTDSTGPFSPKALNTVSYITEADGNLLLSAGDCKVRLNTASSPWSIDFLNADGKTVHSISANDICLGSKDGTDCRVKLKGDVSTGEVIYGFGERYNSFNQVGKYLKLWNTDTGYHVADEASEKNLSYTNVPIFNSSKGYTLYFNSVYGGTADIAYSNSNEYSLEFAGTDFDVFVYTGTPLENIKAYTNLTGKPFKAPEWAFGYWIGDTAGGWKSESASAFETNLKYRLEQYKNMGTIPAAVFLEGLNDSNKNVIKIANLYGVKPLIWENPAITLLSGDGLSLDGLRKLLPGIDDFDLPAPHSYDNLRVRAYWGDFSNPNIKTALKTGGFTELINMGVRGAMVDYGEYIDEDMAFYNGMSGAEMHNYYAYVYNKTVSEIFSEDAQNDYVLFARAGCAGSQSYAGSFAGDLKATFYGLRMANYAGLSISSSGFSNWGSDIGAYHEMPSNELYMRWLEFSTFSPFMRSHCGKDAWKFSAEAKNAFVKYYWLRENLTDYIYSANLQAASIGYPMMRPMAMAFPDEKQLAEISDQYMFGDSLLVCPVLDEGQTSREVTLPSGNWVNLFTGYIHNGNNTMSVEAPADTIPLFMRAGSVIKAEVSGDYTLCSDMNDARYDALVISKGDIMLESTYYTDDKEYTFKTENIVGGYRLSNVDSDNTNVLINVGTSVWRVVVDGKELTKLSSKPANPNTTGWYTDSDGRTIVFTGGAWTTAEIF